MFYFVKRILLADTSTSQAFCAYGDYADYDSACTSGVEPVIFHLSPTPVRAVLLLLLVCWCTIYTSRGKAAGL